MTPSVLSWSGTLLLVLLSCASSPEEPPEAPVSESEATVWLSGVWHRNEPESRLPSVLHLTTVSQPGSKLLVVATASDGRTEVAGSWCVVPVAPDPMPLGSFGRPPWNDFNARIQLPGWGELEAELEIVVGDEDWHLDLRVLDRRADAHASYELRGRD